MASYLHGLLDCVATHPNFAFAAVFLLALSEAIPVVGTVVPGSSLVLGTCALVTAADVKPWPGRRISGSRCRRRRLVLAGLSVSA
jgi:hypothetical protein